MTESEGRKRLPWLTSSWAQRAAAEFIVIVVGVLVALAVDGWREDQAERVLEREYLERLLADVRTGRDRLIGFGREHLHAAERNMEVVAPFLRYGDPIPIDTLPFIAALYQSSRSVVLNLDETYPNTTFEELRSTGGFILIQDPELRSAVMAHYFLVERSASRFALLPREYRGEMRSIIPADVQRSIYNQCDRREPPSACTFDLGRLNAGELLRSLQGNREVSRMLEFSLQQTRISIPWAEELITDAENLTRLLEAALES
jgi:hypothetical protein